MSQKNTLTIGGAGAGGVTALQIANDLATLTMAGAGALDGQPGVDLDLATFEAALRVLTVLWGVAVTIAAAGIGRLVANFIEPQSSGKV